MSLCSVIIVAKNGGKILFATIESVLRQDKLAELIIVDIGNTPAVISRLQQRNLSEPRLKIVPVQGEVNIAKAYNLGARQASSEYLLLLKPGYLLPPDALSEFMSVLEAEKYAMLCSGLIQEYDGKVKSLYRKQVATPKSIFLDIISIGFSKHRIVLSSEQTAAKSFEVATIPSACMCVRAGDYKKLGGLDTDFFPQAEEIDFSLRVQQIGGRVLCVPGVKVTHLPSGLGDNPSLAELTHEMKNTIRYLNKFFAGRQIMGVLLLLNILVILDFSGKAILSLVNGFFQNIRPQYNNIRAKRLILLAFGEVDIARSEQLAKKIVLVTGATSQIGLSVIRRLISSGAAVLALSRGDEIPYQHANLRWLKGDLSDPGFHLDGYCVDVVVHCAALWHLPPVMEVLHNSEAKRIIAFGSTSVFSNLLTVNNFEKDIVLRLQNSENLLAEKCTELNIAYTIFRPTLTYGAGIDSDITILARIISRFGCTAVYPPAIGRRQPVHVDDLAVAMIQAIDNQESFNKSYNLSGGEIFSFREMVERIFALYKKKPKIISSTALPFILDVAGKLSRKKHINGEIARRMNDDMVFFHDDSTRDFGYNPRKFLSGGQKDIEGF